MKKSIALVLGALSLGLWNASGAVIQVSNFNDAVNGNTSSISALQGNPGPDGISLREAVMAANATAGSPHTILVPAGTHNLNISGGSEGFSGNAAVGDLDITRSGITIEGMSGDPAATVIRQNTPANLNVNDRVIEVNPNLEPGFIFNLTRVTITGGRTPDAGGGLVCGSAANITTITSCIFSNNTAINAGSPGGGLSNLGGGNLILVDSTFVNNSTTASSGGGVSFESNPNSGWINVTNCVFTNNASASGSDGGGGLYILGTGTSIVTKSLFINNKITAGSGGNGGGLFFGSSGTLNLSLCSFSGNQVQGTGGRGGAIQANQGIVNVSFCRIVGNTAASGAAIYRNGGTLTADDNWWGVNTGPAANVIANNTSPTRWLQLRHSPSSATVAINQSTVVTADILGRNSGGTLSASSLTGLPSFPNPAATIFSGATLGNLSSAGTQFVNGTVSATYTAGGIQGSGTVNAAADSQSVQAAIAIDAPATVVGVTSSLANGAYRAGQLIPITVTFNEAVTVTGSPTLTLETGNSDAVVTYSSGSGSTTLTFNYTVAAGHTSSDLDYTSASALSLNGGSIKSGALNLNASLSLASPGTAGSLGANKALLIDTTAPTIQISNPSATTVSGGSVTYTVTYADANFASSSLAGANITLNATGGASGSLSVSGSGSTRTVTISGISGNGTLGISIAAGTATDSAGNTAPAAGPSATVAVDTSAPTVSISTPSVFITNANGSVTFTVTYADANFASSTLTTANVTLNKTGNANGTVAISGTGTTRTVTVSNLSGNGTIGLSIAAGTASDTAGNLAPSAGPSSFFTVDTISPTSTISAPSFTMANASASITYMVSYSDQNFSTCTLTPANITLNKTGTADATVSVSGTGPTRIVTLSSFTGNGTIGISIPSGTASDFAGNTAPAAGPSGTITVDTTAPTVSISAPSKSITANGSVTYTVSYSDTNLGGISLAAGHITLNKTGTANGTVGVSGSGPSRTVTISGITGDGTLGISVAAGSAADLMGNAAPAAGPSATFAVDNTAPTLTCPTTLTVNANPGSCSATNLSLGTPTTSDAGGVAFITNNAPSTFPIGTNLVTWTVVDQVGLSNECTQLVVVNDAQAPSITCPADILVTAAPGASSSSVSFTVAATDTCSAVNISSIPASGSIFQAGATIVTNVAIDASGNSNVCTFTVTVNRTPFAGTNTVGTVENQPLNITVAQLLADDSDPDNDLLTLQSISNTSSNGASVTLTNTTVTYIPVAGFVGEDRFTYVINDGRGGNSTGTVLVTIISADSPALNHIAIKPLLTGKLLRFVGNAGATYKFQSAGAVTGVWIDLGTPLTANAAGLIEYEHNTSSGPAQQFYRTVSVP